ncbi:MAG: hypothetical protein K0R67_3980 [Paenibacillus sp.]|nr:hypothetical protein [Paenibacillus sp.]
MKIVITDIQKDHDTISVLYTSEYGSGRAIWMSIEPDIRKEYFVEIDIPEIVQWGLEITLSEQKLYSLKTTGDVTWINGLLESVEEDGVITMRLGQSILLVESTGEPLSCGKFVELKANKMLLFDSNI